jgi:SAM-dependent methyltransferase
MVQPFSFRDVDGYLIQEGTSISRFVQHSYAHHYEQLMGSGLYQHLVEKGLLVPYKEKQQTTEDERKFYRILKPEFIPFINYPYEWTALQWKEVLLSFLKINKIALEYGMILKDATPFNFTFYAGKCVFIDTLSFEKYTDGDAWVAYRQFCESMLGPMALIYFNDVAWIRLFQSNINGWPLSFISKNLSWKTWLQPSLLLHIHWHARFSNKNRTGRSGSGFSKEKLLILVDMLSSAIQKWGKPKEDILWSDYYDTGILSDKYLTEKENTVSDWIKIVDPVSVIDLGANNGRFSLMASEEGAKVIAVEFDHSSLERLRSEINHKKLTNIETVLADITQPSAGVGWDNRERISLLDRLQGDLVLSLALIHHLCISANVPISFIAEMLANMSNRFLIIEFIPRTDPKVIQLLTHRKDIFMLYTEEAFIQEFSIYFALRNSTQSNYSDRKLFLWEKK